MSVKNCFIRGSVIRYVQVPEESVDTDLLQDAARREAAHVASQQKEATEKVSAANTATVSPVQ